ncbi:ABC transporter permease subunit [Tsukamurella sp. NPDC003166]|uniref:ABC transporter permease n=1 Tax=Tsukamurella sp. NPDC003166 TaxID=3154444 RepID=UPI0033BA8945
MIRLMALVVRRSWAVVLAIVVWEAVVRIGDYNVVVMPGPGDVGRTLLTDTGRFLNDTGTTFAVTLMGLTVGTVVGVVLAIAVRFSPLIGGLVTPTAILIRTIPIVVFIPILARVFGYQNSSVVMITVLIVVFPAFAWTLSGLQATSASIGDIFTVYGASRWRRVLLLELPSAAPNILMSARVSGPAAVTGTILGEFLVGDRGLGHLFVESMNFGKPIIAWSGAAIATIFCVLLYTLTNTVERVGRRRLT